jgi:nucleoside-diphosphate-sugar epimerase
LSAEQLVLNGSIPHRCVLRSALVYGPGVKGNIARMVHAVQSGRFPALPARRNRRSAVHVEDLVTALLLAATRDEANGRAFIISDGHAFSTRDMYEWILRALDKPPPRWQVPWGLVVGAARVGDVAARVTRRPMPFDSSALDKLMGSAWFESSVATTELGFVPAHSLASAMPELVASLNHEARG